MSEPPIPTPQFSRRLIEAERDCYVAWAEALAAADGNIFHASVHHFGRATAVICPAVPAQIVNRVFGLTADDAQYVPAICELFDAQGAAVCVELDPYAEYGPTNALLAALRHAGLSQTGFHQMIHGIPSESDPVIPDGIRISPAGPDDAQAFGCIHEKVWGDGRLITALLPHPEFHCWIAWSGDVAAALGVLHVKGEIASMANGITIPNFRGRGIQAALLRHRIHVAAQMGCRLIVSQASPRNPSLRNHVRAGLGIAGSKAIWTR